MRCLFLLVAVWGMAAWSRDSAGQEPARGAFEPKAALEELLPIVVKVEPYGMGRDRPLSPWHVGGILQGGFRYYVREHRPLLEESLLPLLMKTALERPRRWLVVGPLAAMYRMGRAEKLPALVRDEQAPAAQRVIAVAALYRAGEETPVETLIPMLRTTREPDLQQAVIWLLGQSADPAAVETVVGCLRHPARELHETAAYAVSYQKPPAAIEPLAERIRQCQAEGRHGYWYTRALGEIEDPQTAHILAQLLAEALKTSGPDDVLLDNLTWAFGSAVERSFREEGKTHEERARAALAWWRREGDGDPR